MSPRGTLFLAAVVALASGCADAGGAPAAGPSGPGLGEAEVSQTTGGVSGLVLDEELVPIFGAQVFLEGTDFAAITGPSGAFAFSLVEPGAYTLRVNRTGYGDELQSIEVLLGEVTHVQAFLKAALKEEYVEVQAYRGMSRSVRMRVGQECILVLMPPLRTCTGLSPNRLSAVSDVEPDWTNLVGELYWTPVSAGFNQWAILYVQFPNTTNTLGIPDQNSPGYFQFNGKSPVRGHIAVETLVARNQPPENMHGNVGWYAYSDYSDVNTTFFGAGSMIDQPLDFLLSTFHKLPVPEGYTALPDA